MDIAIDLGTGRTRVFIEGKGKVLDEATVIAYDADTNGIYAVGDEAARMIGKTPLGIVAARPLECGVVSLAEQAETLVTILLREVCKYKIAMPRIVASIPCELTEVEKRAIVNAVSAFGARRVYLIESPKAAALGCGLPITSPHGTLLADLGSGTADIGVISLGGLSIAKSVKKAGNAMDEEIIRYIRKTYNLIIGENMAEACKTEIGCVRLPEEPKTFRVKGRDAVTGLPRYADVRSDEIMDAIFEIAQGIVSAIRGVLEATPPELISDIYTDGIILTGGLAKLSGLAKLISDATKLRVRVHKYSPDCVIMGCGKAIQFINDADKGITGTGISPVIAAY